MTYLLYGMGAISAVLAGALWFQTARLERYQAQFAISTANLVACSGRLQNVIEDLRSDNAIDNLSDDDLRDVPAEWLLTSPGDT